MTRETVAWQAWTKDVLPGRVSRSHVARDDKTTLCGLPIPFDAEGGDLTDLSCRTCDRIDRLDRARRVTP